MKKILLLTFLIIPIVILSQEAENNITRAERLKNSLETAVLDGHLTQEAADEMYNNWRKSEDTWRSKIKRLKSFQEEADKKYERFMNREGLTDPMVTASALLTAYKSRDIQKMLMFFPLESQNEAKDMLQNENNGRYNSIWKGWRWERVQAWNSDDLELCYVMPESEASVEFGDSSIVNLYWENGKWRWEDINNGGCDY